MAVEKYRVSLDGLPAHLIHQEDDVDVLKLKLHTQGGRKSLSLYEGQVIRTEDPFVKTQLASYRVPKMVPIHVRKKGEANFTRFGHAPDDLKDKVVFVKVANNVVHHTDV